jgi:hypothetical protein
LPTRRPRGFSEPRDWQVTELPLSALNEDELR